ncbi:MAG TPA: glycoside hydrolase family 3 N-terminal domain-containing protein [Pseudolysinimonas sp.]|jgi:beta-N-acetylhexosaminidase|nr:glycoside hydrolase family 3 N-terminal domain-containing protein [Pseudolysinimonas sp.]
MSRLAVRLLAVAAGLALLAGCVPSPGPATPPVVPPTPSPTIDPLAGLSLEQRVGQLFIVGSPATEPGTAALDAVQNRFAGGVFLSGRSALGVDATRAVVDQLTAASSSGSPLLVATDQEGGEVQVLRGPGFSSIPSGLEQGGEDVAALTAQAAAWGAELAAAGINLDLAPVSDVVADAASAPGNAPIGAFHREFGYDQETVEQHAAAFMAGMRSSGILTSPKHFPGLGLVAENTDTTAGVTDSLTDENSPSVLVARTLIGEGADCLMVSTADYALLDPGTPAAFSPVIVDGLLRQGLGFTGVIVTDDLSAATQVTAWSPAERAILSIEAGDDIVLVSRYPRFAAEMIDAVVAKARTDAAFAAKVDAAARRVLDLKAGLIDSR